jgi:GntR family transcriptional regulator/MocR family aminotransferase
MRTRPAFPLTGLAPDPGSPEPLCRQLYGRLRGLILGGRLGPSWKLPSTRALAADLGVARNTVMAAYEQLLAEGYLHGRAGSGTYVTASLPEHLLHAPAPPGPGGPRGPTPHGLSRRGAALAALPGFAEPGRPVGPFRHGLPALDEFPFALWARLTARRWRARPARLLGYGDPAGYRPLREAIAGYLAAARGVRCDPDQVVVVAGSQQGLELAARVLLDPGDAALVEDPGYPGARGALLAAGARLVAVPVDAEGMNVAAARPGRARARLAYVTPARQYPLGVTMSAARRLALLAWAARAGAWVLEDDYDSEYRYAGRPLAALQGLDRDGRVLYLGTFSKVLFPALRLGYLIVPPGLVEPFARARALADWHSMTLTQAVLADFLAEGHFARHVRRMRTLYAERQAALVAAAARELVGLLDVPPADAGMQLVGWLPPGLGDVAAARRAAAAGVAAHPLSSLGAGPGRRPGLLLGYTGFTPRQIRDGVRRLAQALRP